MQKEGLDLLTIIIITGVAGFFLFLASEVTLWKKSGRYLTLSLQLAAFLLSLASHCLVLTGPRNAVTPMAVTAGAILLASAASLLYRSLWADLPKNAYSGGPGRPVAVCRQGTYAIVRHPGVWWYALFLLGLYLVSGAQWLLRAGLIWWLTDLCLVFIEDLYLYPRLISGYSAYKKEVPMLIPSWRKLKHFRK